MADSNNGSAPDPSMGLIEQFEFAGWGTAERITELDNAPVKVKSLASSAQHKLGELGATAICGNDITSSCLYVSALCAAQAGWYAWIALSIVAAVLFLFRKIYGEVGSALPLNGGAYNVLLNTTSKGKASIAAVLTILSYIATAVISALEAMHYAHNLWHGLPVMIATVVLLFLFAALNWWGIAESAGVAIFIFIFHLGSLLALVGFTVLSIILNGAPEWSNNYMTPAPAGGFTTALFFGFAAAMLGVSGFESSANFIEEQKDGVFPKTLRNMWIAVSVFNPLLSALTLAILPLASGIIAHESDLLAHLGFVVGSNYSPLMGTILQKWISVDAVLVLSGAVLTSYVGVTGLVRRMSLDRTMPQFLLRQNKLRQTNHWIIFGFFLVCASILAITKGNLKALAGVYTLSFLSVMALFAIGNMLLKMKRSRLPRAIRAPWIYVLVALAAVTAGWVGNAMMNPDYLQIFGIYFAVALGVVLIMFMRISLLKGVLLVAHAIIEGIKRGIVRNLTEITSQPVIFFTNQDDLELLNRAAQYVKENEQTRRLKVVHVYSDESDIPEHLAEHLATLDKVYPMIRIDFLAVKGEFGPELIERLSATLGVPKNYMFIGTPGDKFPHDIAKLGGVRLIM